jgi:hypothetical protein
MLREEQCRSGAGSISPFAVSTVIVPSPSKGQSVPIDASTIPAAGEFGLEGHPPPSQEPAVATSPSSVPDPAVPYLSATQTNIMTL